MRSATAHKIFENDDRFDVKSAGTDQTASTVLTRELLEWADSIVVMEKVHRNFIQKKFKDIYKTKRISCLYIPDDYDFMNPGLISILKERFESVQTRGLLGPRTIGPVDESAD